MRLWQADGLFQSEITEKTLKDKSRVTRLVGGLAAKGLLEKRAFAGDRRNFRLYLTEKGCALKLHTLPIVIEIMEISARNIPAKDMEITLSTLKKIFGNVNKSLAEKE